MNSNASGLIDPLTVYRPERSSSSLCWSLQPRGLRQEAIVSTRMVYVCPSLAAMMAFGPSMATEFCTNAIANKLCRLFATVNFACLRCCWALPKICPFILDYTGCRFPHVQEAASSRGPFFCIVIAPPDSGLLLA
jgi:hypothetical protein